MTDLHFDQINAAILFDLLWSKPLWLAFSLSAVSCFSSVQLQDLCAAPVRLHPPSPVHSVSLHPSVCLSADSISPSWPTVTSSVTTLVSVIPSAPVCVSVPLPRHQDLSLLPAAYGWNHNVWHHRHAQHTEGENEKDHRRNIWNQITSEFFYFFTVI